MKKNTYLLNGVLLVGALLFMGAGCKGADVFKNVTDTVTDAAGMSELEYYNLVIEKSNEIKDDVDSYQSDFESYLTTKDSLAATGNGEVSCNYTAPILVENSYNNAKRELVDNKPSMQDSEKQGKIEEKLNPYLESYKGLNDYAKEFQDYCDREQFKDDNGAKMTEYEDGIIAKINDVVTKQSDLFALVKEYQKDVDLGIDENTDKPNEVAVLIQNKLTDQVEVMYQESFTPYAQAVLEGKEADFAPVEQSYNDLLAEIKTQEERGNAVGLPSDTILQAAYTSYIDSVKGVTVELEKLVRDQKNGEITAENIVDYDDSIVNAYDSVISAHNVLVSALEGYVKL